MQSTILTLAALGAVASAYDLPDNLRAIYEEHLVSPTSSVDSANLVVRLLRVRSH